MRNRTHIMNLCANLWGFPLIEGKAASKYTRKRLPVLYLVWYLRLFDVVCNILVVQSLDIRFSSTSSTRSPKPIYIINTNVDVLPFHSQKNIVVELGLQTSFLKQQRWLKNSMVTSQHNGKVIFLHSKKIIWLLNCDFKQEENNILLQHFSFDQEFIAWF